MKKNTALITLAFVTMASVAVLLFLEIVETASGKPENGFCGKTGTTCAPSSISTPRINTSDRTHFPSL
jgi:hypothetical protein